MLRERLDAGRLGDFDLVLHMGACSATTEQDASYLVRNNYEFSKDLCQWALSHGAGFVYASSAATYGDGSAGMDDDAAGIERLRPLNMYGYSKLLFDRWARDQSLLSRVAGLRFFNVFGPNEDHKGDMRSVVHKACAQVQAEGRVQLFRSHHPDYRDGEQRRDFVYVKDVVDMTLHVAARGATGLFNVGSGQRADVARPGAADLLGVAGAGADRLRGHARGPARHVPVPHAGRRLAPARDGLHRSRRRRYRLPSPSTSRTTSCRANTSAID